MNDVSGKFIPVVFDSDDDSILSIPEPYSAEISSPSTAGPETTSPRIKSSVGVLGTGLLAAALKMNECWKSCRYGMTRKEQNYGSTCLERRNKLQSGRVYTRKNTLRIYKLDISRCCRVAWALGWNTTVRSLDMTGIKLKSKWAKEFRWGLEQNQTLKEVNLSKTSLKDKGVVYVVAGLFKNQYLESLYLDGNWFSGVGVEHLLCPLSSVGRPSFSIQLNRGVEF